MGYSQTLISKLFDEIFKLSLYPHDQTRETVSLVFKVNIEFFGGLVDMIEENPAKFLIVPY